MPDLKHFLRVFGKEIELTVVRRVKDKNSKMRSKGKTNRLNNNCIPSRPKTENMINNETICQ